MSDPARRRPLTFAMAAGAGGAALVVSLWADWFRADLSEAPAGTAAMAARFNVDLGVDAWASFGAIDLLLALAGLAAVALAVCAVARPLGRGAQGAGVIAANAGSAGVLLVVLRIAVPPGRSATPTSGAFLGLAAALVLTGGALLWMRHMARPAAATASPQVASAGCRMT